MAEADIYNVLNTGVTALGSRIYPLKLPQDVRYPAVVYQRISSPRYQAFGKTVGLQDPIIQVDVYEHQGKGYEAFEAVASAVETALTRYEGGAIVDTYVENDRDDYEENAELFRKSFDVRVWAE